MRFQSPLASRVFGAFGVVAWVGAAACYFEQERHRSLASSDLFAAGAATILQYCALLFEDTYAAMVLAIVGTLFVGFAAVVDQISRSTRPPDN